MKEKISTVDLKALYDFSIIHCERMEHTGTNNERKDAERERDGIYKELLKRLNNAYVELALLQK